MGHVQTYKSIDDIPEKYRKYVDRIKEGQDMMKELLSGKIDNLRKIEEFEGRMDEKNRFSTEISLIGE